MAHKEDNLEKFIRRNKDKFGVYSPSESHMEKFLIKINYGIRQIISIVPYLIRVAVVTVFIFLGSIILWNNFIRKDRREITLRNKISLVVSKIMQH